MSQAELEYPEIVKLDRVNVIMRLTLALRARGTTRWRVQSGEGATYGQLLLTSETGVLTPPEQTELTTLLGLDALVGRRGVLVEDSYDHYVAMIDRAEGRPPRLVPEELTW